MIIAADPHRAEADVQAGKLPCPHWGGRLQGWSYARARWVRQLVGGDLVVRPRRVLCRACARSRVILPSSCLPRRADATDVVGNTLHAKASGPGHRRIAADLGRSPSTVRRWLRAARGEHAQWLRQRGASVIVDLEPDILNRIKLGPDPAGARSLLAARASARRLDPDRRRHRRSASSPSALGLKSGSVLALSRPRPTVTMPTYPRLDRPVDLARRPVAPAGSSTSFGFQASGNQVTPSLSCTAS